MLSAEKKEEYDYDPDQPLGKEEEVIVHAYDMIVEDNFKDSGTTEIHLWSLDQQSIPHLLRVQDFPNFCHLELPAFIEGRQAYWNQDSAALVVKWIKDVLSKDGDAPTGWLYTLKPKIYYYRADTKYPMLLLMFKTMKAMSHCSNLFNKPRKIGDLGTMKIDVWETGISSIRKMFTMQDVRYAQWFRISGQEVPIDHELRISTAGTNGRFGLPIVRNREYIVNWKTMVGIPTEETVSWATHPRLLAKDIETYTDNHRAFPNALNTKHTSYLSSYDYMRLGDPNSRRKFAVIVGDCDEIPGVTLFRVKDEVEKIAMEAELFRELDPELKSGFNIFAYDDPYDDTRLKIKLKEWPQMGRLLGRLPVMNTKSWKSDAYGHNNISILRMEGRLSVDMLPIVRRDYKLDKYDLDTVSKEFLKRGKHEVAPKEMFQIFERLKAAISAAHAVRSSSKKIRAKANRKVRLAEQEKKAYIQGLERTIATLTATLEKQLAADRLSFEIGTRALIAGEKWVSERRAVRAQLRTAAEQYGVAQLESVVATQRQVKEDIEARLVAYTSAFHIEARTPTPRPEVLQFYQTELSKLTTLQTQHANLLAQTTTLMQALDASHEQREQATEEEYLAGLRDKLATHAPPNPERLAALEVATANLRRVREAAAREMSKWTQLRAEAVSHLTLDIECENALAAELTAGAAYTAAQDQYRSAELLANQEAMEKAGLQMDATQELLEQRRRERKHLESLQQALETGFVETLLDRQVEELERLEEIYSNAKEALTAPPVLEPLPAEVEAILEELAKAKAEMARVTAYCVEDSALVVDLFIKLNVWVGLCELASIVGVTIIELFTRGQQIRCLSQIYHLASKWNYVIDKRVAAWQFSNGGFVFDPIPGLYDNILCFDFASLYPSIMEAYNICYTTFVPPELMDIVPDDLCNVVEFTQDEPLTGGGPRPGAEEAEDLIAGVNDEEVPADEEDEDKKTVKKHYRYKFVKAEVRQGIVPKLVHDLVAERGIKKKVIKKLEGEWKIYDTLRKAFRNELTPAQFLAETQLSVQEKEELLISQAGREEAQRLSQEAVEKLQALIKHMKGWIVFLGTMKAEVPRDRFLLELKERIALLEHQLTVLDKQQNALKVSANSMFGFFGAQNGGLLPLIEAGMSITAMGRWLIGSVNKYIEGTYQGKIVYGDTDSSMVSLPQIQDPKECDYWGNRLMVEISGQNEERDEEGKITKPFVKGLFPPPLRVEFEKAMRLLCLKKKKYAAYLITKDGHFKLNENGSRKMMTKGIVLARRDNPKLLKRIYSAALSKVLDRAPIEETYQILCTEIAKLLRGEIPVRGNLTIIRSLGADYKQASYFMKVFSDELRRMGKPVNSGDRLEYVVVKTAAEAAGQEVKLGMKMRSVEMWEEAWEEAERVKAGGTPSADVYPAEVPDYIYYIEHTLMNALDQLFSIGYLKQLESYAGIGYKPQFSRAHFCSIQSPVKMIGKLIADQLKGMAAYPASETEKLKVIAGAVEGLPAWFKAERERVDAASAPPVAARSRFVLI